MNLFRRRIHSILYLSVPVVLLVSVLASSAMVYDGLAQAVRAQAIAEPFVVQLPIISHGYPWQSPFSFQTRRASLTDAGLAAKAEGLGVGWVRVSELSWRKVQPVEGGAYDWSVLSAFEDELRAIRQLGLTPTVSVVHSPPWATINEPFQTDCGAVRADKFSDFAQFMRALAERYSDPEFNVHYWELGNEPDVDPKLVNVDSVFGCWGDIDDPYYAGEHYGEMLKVVTPAIRAADSRAKVLIGGLLLAEPNTTTPNRGKPELFLKGILEAGAAPYFDIVPFHAYPSYVGVEVDYDNGVWSGDWQPWGGYTVGKARFLRQIMAGYGVTKPLFLNETTLGCNDAWYDCDPPPPEFFEAQANYLVRTFTRDLAEDITSLTWFTLDGPGWRDGGLLEDDLEPRASYIAYQQLATRLVNTQFERTVDYGSAVEAYSFSRTVEVVHVVWSIDFFPDTILVPQAKFLAAYDRNGSAVVPTPVGSDYEFTVGFSPIYVELKP